MDVRSAFDARDGFHVLDVREPEEWQLGHVEGALHVPLQEVAAAVESLPRDKPILCVCMVGIRSQYAATLLASAGFETQNLDGGLAAWHAEGLPLVTADGTPAQVWMPR